MRAIVFGIVLSTLAGCAHRATLNHSPSAQAPMTPPAGASSPSSVGPDPTITDPANYIAVLENERVRVLRYHDEPGARTQQHHHPESVLYALTAFRRRLTFPDGTTREREFKAGDVMWVPAQTHVGENIGTTPTEVLLIELKSH
ncbi:MAG TPA: hypothetical protein VER33_09205 [Polyangiaceae bacterium]|nr:hypothetical protein [Polyangiaceae bacterium]